MSDLKTPYEIVVLGDMSGRAKASVWSNLAGIAKKEVLDRYPTSMGGGEHRAQFELILEAGEEQYMQEYHEDKPDMWLRRKGRPMKLNTRKYLPAAYRTAKSVAANCLERGVKMHDDDGNVKAKSVCEKEYKSNTVRKEGEEVTTYDKAFTLMSKVEKLLKDTSLNTFELGSLQAKAELLELIARKQKEALDEST